MNIKNIEGYPVAIAVAEGDEIIISDAQSALDLMATVRYMTGSDCVALGKEAVCEEFFTLSTGIAGEILQKFVTYNMRLAIVGDFSKYTSKPLKDFMYESNKGTHVMFAKTEEEAFNWFSGR